MASAGGSSGTMANLRRTLRTLPDRRRRRDHAPPPPADEQILDLERRRDELQALVAELQWDLGGLVHEMAVRDRIRVDVLVRRAADLQDADAELNEVERILRTEQTGTAGVCGTCGAPHSLGAVYCWQCGHQLLSHMPSDAIGAP
jgi:chorismate mutase